MSVGNKDYKRGGEVLRIEIRAPNRSLLDRRSCNLADARESARLIKWLVEKYGIRLDEGLIRKEQGDFISDEGFI